ncbi:hypothetical protein BDQ17DRAFT_1343425 [Cyathus striatus]|nr:hypothetical protein BDQ17DRAFT_1343425 [Cyathus striatus]
MVWIEWCAVVCGYSNSNWDMWLDEYLFNNSVIGESKIVTGTSDNFEEIEDIKLSGCSGSGSVLWSGFAQATTRRVSVGRQTVFSAVLCCLLSRMFSPSKMDHHHLPLSTVSHTPLSATALPITQSLGAATLFLSLLFPAISISSSLTFFPCRPPLFPIPPPRQR